MSQPISPLAQDIYVVEFERHSGDLGVALIVRANCEALAKLEALRRFPEYKRYFSRTFVHLLDYAEIDWESGQSYIVKQKKRPSIPVFKIDDSKPVRERKKRDEKGTE